MVKLKRDEEVKTGCRLTRTIVDKAKTNQSSEDAE